MNYPTSGCLETVKTSIPEETARESKMNLGLGGFFFNPRLAFKLSVPSYNFLERLFGTNLHLAVIWGVVISQRWQKASDLCCSNALKK